MEDKNKLSLEDLLTDTSFVNWAKNQNKNDVSYWNAWIKRNPNHLEMILDAKDIVRGISFAQKKMDDDQVERALQNVMAQAKQSKKSIKKNKPRIVSLRFIGYAAAILALLVPLGYAFFSTSSTVTHKTGYGEIIDLTLPDGSQVVLNGNSEINYDKENPRDIFLSGQASFKVEKKPSTKAKFWVKTDDLTIEVLGTEFNVSTLNDKTDVILDEGSVKLLLEDGETKQMVPGDLVSYAPDRDEVIHEQVRSETKYISWKEGSYVFNNVTLGEVMEYVAHNYGVSYEFEDQSIKNISISGGIPNANLEICILAIQKASTTVINRLDDKLIIKREPILNSTL